MTTANVNERTKVAPTQIIFGLIKFDKTALINETMTTTPSCMLQQQDNLMKITRANILLADSIHNANIVKGNNYVLAVPCSQPKKRLQAQWSGPY